MTKEKAAECEACKQPIHLGDDVYYVRLARDGNGSRTRPGYIHADGRCPETWHAGRRRGLR